MTQKAFVFGDQTFYLIRADPQAIKRVAELSGDSSGSETFEAIEAAVLSMIDPRDDALARFELVVNNNDDPVTFPDLVELFEWMLEAQKNRAERRLK